MSKAVKSSINNQIQGNVCSKQVWLYVPVQILAKHYIKSILLLIFSVEGTDATSAIGHLST
jgi:hypothetical protein